MLTVRPAAAADLAAVAAIESASFPSPWGAEVYRPELGQRESVFLAAEDGGEVVGFVLCYWVLDEAHLIKLAVRPDRRRRGAAATLLDALIDELRGRGVRELWLEVRHQNAAGLAFYAGRGFSPVGVRRRYYADTGEDAVVMLLQL